MSKSICSGWVFPHPLTLSHVAHYTWSGTMGKNQSKWKKQIVLIYVQVFILGWISPRKFSPTLSHAAHYTSSWTMGTTHRNGRLNKIYVQDLSRLEVFAQQVTPTLSNVALLTLDFQLRWAKGMSVDERCTQCVFVTYRLRPRTEGRCLGTAAVTCD